MRVLLMVLMMSFCLMSTSCARRVVVKQPNKKVVIVKRPAKYKVVRVNGRKYYVWNGRYHRKTSRGYVVVRV